MASLVNLQTSLAPTDPRLRPLTIVSNARELERKNHQQQQQQEEEECPLPPRPPTPPITHLTSTTNASNRVPPCAVGYSAPSSLLSVSYRCCFLLCYAMCIFTCSYLPTNSSRVRTRPLLEASSLSSMYFVRRRTLGNCEKRVRLHAQKETPLCRIWNRWATQKRHKSNIGHRWKLYWPTEGIYASPLPWSACVPFLTVYQRWRKMSQR